MKIKLLVADVDGTLVTRAKLLTPRALDALARLREAGVQFALTSGRPPRGLAKLVSQLHLTTALAAFNGGVYVKPDLKTVLAQRTIAPDIARHAVDYLLRAGLDVWVYQGWDWFLRGAEAPHVARESQNVGFQPTLISDLGSVLEEPIKLVGISDDLALVERCERELSARLGTGASAARSQPYFLDITHPEANKGMVVREASRILKIPLHQIATIGDMSNDVPMLTVAGMGIAMGNASPEVQAVARHVTGSNEHEGFAHAVDTFILGQPPFAQTDLGLPPRTRGCLFGLEGVLAQTTRIDVEAWKRLFDDYLRLRARAGHQPFVPFDAVQDYLQHIHGRGAQAAIRSFLDARGIELPDATIEALSECKGEILTELLDQKRPDVYEGSLEFLQAARQSGLRVAVVSPDDHCQDVLRSAGVADLFDACIDGPFAAARRLEGQPAPDAHLAGAQALGLDCDEIAVFEADPRGVAAGRAGHFAYIVGIDRAGQPADLRRAGADVVVSDLGSLLSAEDDELTTVPGAAELAW
ncbi:MAG: Cof-type HAD-IIB family hydrolase [Pseudomonadota bacterium]